MPDLRLSQFSDESRLSQIAHDLRRMTEGDVRFSKHERLLFATDASIYQVEPIGVVAPRTVDEVQRIVEYCAASGLPILPRGGGTSLAGQAVNRAIVIDFSRYCTNVLDIDVAAKTATVEPGVVLAHLNHALLPHGLMFGPDVATATHANIGGMIGNNSAGAHSVLYGRTVEHLLGLDVILADGSRIAFDEGAAMRDERVARTTRQIADVILPLAQQIDDRFPKILRHVDGYNLDIILNQLRNSSDRFENVNLAHLLCGSEGTLGVTIGAKLRLVDAPKRKGLAVVACPGVDEALAAVSVILETKPAAIELLDDVVLGLAKQNVECRRYVEMMPVNVEGTALTESLLYVEYFAHDDAELASKFAALESIAGRLPIKRFTSGPEMAMAWSLRAAGEPLLHGLPGARKPLTFVEDAAVDPARLPEFIAKFRNILNKHGTTAAYYAHASVGCLHVRPMIDLRDARDRDAMQRIAEEVSDLVMQYGGALSGEHGDGRLRSHLLERFYGREIFDAFRRIKSICDPRNRMNPGIIVDAPADEMVENLRVKPAERFLDPPSVAANTYFRYEHEHGFGGAVEMCNGAGVCRKTSGGTMCPSYRATRDERHATRGRGNALRLAITGQLSIDGSPAWNDRDTFETLDLCLSCKACKSECPSNVDIAKLKAEYLAQSWDARGRAPFAIRAVGNVRAINRLGSAIAPIANAIARLGPTRAMINRLMGIDARRSLPAFERSLHRWMRSRPTTQNSGLRTQNSTVILFPDCFTVYNEPRVGRAAIEVLERLGYRVVLPKDVGCCGRSLISVGMLREAQTTCARTANALIECVERESAVAVLGCEPSCVSAIIDDWQDLDMNVDRAALAMLKERTFAVEDFIAAETSKRRNVETSKEETPRSQYVNKPRAHIAATRSVADNFDVSTFRRLDVYLHGHCHQKALWGTGRTEGFLREFLGDRLTVLDSGCCGMAGSFGYARSRFEVSQAIGELALFPALRENPEAVILAPGTSCRHQIRDALGRTALHPIEFIHRCVANLQKPEQIPCT